MEQKKRRWADGATSTKSHYKLFDKIFFWRDDFKPEGTIPDRLKGLVLSGYYGGDPWIKTCEKMQDKSSAHSELDLLGK